MTIRPNIVPRYKGIWVLGRIDDLPQVVRGHAVEEVIVSMVRVPADVIAGCALVRAGACPPDLPGIMNC